MLLHIISKSPFTHTALDDALPFINEGDTVLLIDDGVYAVTRSDLIQPLSEKKCVVAALVDDICTRGLRQTNPEVNTINMAGFVELAFKSAKTISWF